MHVIQHAYMHMCASPASLPTGSCVICAARARHVGQHAGCPQRTALPQLTRMLLLMHVRFRMLHPSLPARGTAC